MSLWTESDSHSGWHASAALLVFVLYMAVFGERGRAAWGIALLLRMLRGVPVWAGALWAVTLVGLLVACFSLPRHGDGGFYPLSVAGVYFAWSTTLLAWSRWRELIVVPPN